MSIVDVDDDVIPTIRYRYSRYTYSGRAGRLVYSGNNRLSLRVRPVKRAQNVKRADPVNRSVHALLANQHTVSASDICVNVYKMCIKGQPC